jgi:hypothetical protein
LSQSRHLLLHAERVCAGESRRLFISHQHQRRTEGRNNYYNLIEERNVYAPHHFDTEYFLEVATVVATTSQPIGVASMEALQILGLNRARNQVAVYWVPGMRHPIATGHTLFAPIYRNVPPSREGIFIRPTDHAETFAHELGHLFTRAGHIAFKDSPEDFGPEGDLPVENLMYPDGGERTGTVLTENQRTRILRYARRHGYIR